MMIALGALSAGLGAMAPMANAAQMGPGPMDHGPMAHAERQAGRNDELDGRIAHARDSLSRGWAAHQLSRREYSRLSSRLNGIIAEKRRAEHTGRGIDRDEMTRLNAQLDELHRDTKVQKFDNNPW
jgi:hypothetical protein